MGVHWQGNIHALRAGDQRLGRMQHTDVKVTIGQHYTALVGARHPIVARLAARPLKIVDHAKREACLPRSLQPGADGSPPIFGEIGSLEPIAIVRVCPVHAVFHHQTNLPADLLCLHLAVPEPKRADAIFAVRIRKGFVERLETDRGRCGVRRHRPCIP